MTSTSSRACKRLRRSKVDLIVDVLRRRVKALWMNKIRNVVMLNRMLIRREKGSKSCWILFCMIKMWMVWRMNYLRTNKMTVMKSIRNIMSNQSVQYASSI